MIKVSPLLHPTVLRQNSCSKQFSRSNQQKVVTMVKFDINSKAKLNSGYEIPRLGYGVSDTQAVFRELRT